MHGSLGNSICPGPQSSRTNGPKGSLLLGGVFLGSGVPRHDIRAGPLVEAYLIADARLEPSKHSVAEQDLQHPRRL
eukprot:3996964-Pyramimonas_sp.AAC.1